MTGPSSAGSPRAEDGIRATLAEVRREIACGVCRGDIKRCRLAICPYLGRVRDWFEERRDLQTTNLFGASPPSAFVGSWGYPKVLVGPLVPPVRDEDTSILDASESWLSYELPEILRFRLTLVRGKAPRRVAEARAPDSILSTVQEAAMASKPIDTEMWFTKKPTLVSPFSSRAPPSGPSADIAKVDLTSNPSVPRRVDDLVSDTDLRAGAAVADLYDHGISQSHITRVFSVGLLGTKDRRRLVPTEWSITAVDDILAKSLVREVRSFPWISDFEVTSASGLANNVAVLMFPQAFMFEGLEAWNLEAGPTPRPTIMSSPEAGRPIRTRSQGRTTRPACRCWSISRPAAVRRAPSFSWRYTTTGCPSASGAIASSRGRPSERNPHGSRASTRRKPNWDGVCAFRSRIGGVRASCVPTFEASAGSRATHKSGRAIGPRRKTSTSV